MHVKLVRHAFPDRPDWTIIDERIPLGTIYEVIGYERGCTILNKLTGEMRPVHLYFLVGNGSEGYMPTICFERILKES